jgi:hypothetical protein
MMLTLLINHLNRSYDHFDISDIPNRQVKADHNLSMITPILKAEECP